MKWYFLNTGSGSGKFNMDFDLGLTKQIEGEEAVLRIYRWQPYCISLGANQYESIVKSDLIEKDGLEVVKRPTGGRAILHAEELTYSVVMQCSIEKTPQLIYREINNALKAALGIYNDKLSVAELEQQPDFAKIYRQGKGIACFAETAKNELKFGHKKLIGSAQRKIGSIILQHGSILCGQMHKEIVNYLVLDENEKSLMLSELNEKTIEIETIIGEKVDYLRLGECIKTGFEKYFETDFESDAGMFSSGVFSSQYGIQL